MPLSREDSFLEIHQFYTFYPQITSPWVGGHEIYNFLSLYPTDADIPNLVNFAQKFLRRRCKRTTDDAHCALSLVGVFAFVILLQITGTYSITNQDWFIQLQIINMAPVYYR